MRINTDQLARTLDKSLSRAWLIAGDETLLTGEAADAVRARARAEGFSGRDLFVTDRGFNRKSTRLNSSHGYISYAVFCLKKKKGVWEEGPEQCICRVSIRP